MPVAEKQKRNQTSSLLTQAHERKMMEETKVGNIFLDNEWGKTEEKGR